MTSQFLLETIGYELAQTCKLVRTRAHALLGEVGLCRGQQFILSALWKQEGIPHSDLAGQVHVKPATVTSMLKRMEKAGLVERRHDPRDQRVSRVYLTDAGRDIRGMVEGVWRELEAQTFAGFDEVEQNLPPQLLLRIHENLSGERISSRSRG